MLMHAQKADKIWYFGDYAGIDFTSGTPVALTNGAMQSLDNTSTITDTAGTLLFYTNGIDVWNKNHTIMPNGTNLGATTSSGQSALIVSQPFTTKYYIFTIGYAPTDPFRYSIVDLSLNNGLGAITSKSNVLTNGSTEKIDVTYNPNDKNYWILTHAWNSNQFYCYKLDSNGLNTTAVVSSVGSIHSGGSPYGYNAVGQMTFSIDGSKLASVVYSSGTIEVFDFNTKTGVLTNPIYLSGYTNSWGVAFSPNSRFLYFTEWYYNKVWQFDLISGVASTIAATKTQVGAATFPTGTNNYKIGYLQNGPDGKIYIAKYGQHYISAINNPNSSGISCGFTDNAVYLGSNKTCNAGLSRAIKEYGWLNNCSFTYSDTIQICKGDSVYLNGSYWIPPVLIIDTLIGADGCDSIQILHVLELALPHVKLGNDTTYCVGDSVKLFIPNNYVSILWSTGSQSNIIYVSNAGYYWVEVTDSNCTNSDTIEIVNLSNTYININDTSICEGDSWSINLPPYNLYEWYDWSTNSTALISDSGIYYVMITDNCKSYTDTFSLLTEDCNCLIFVPNVFTPNGDGINDNFYPVINCELDQYHMYIFNRWGELLFESIDQHEVWEGNYKGRKAADGVYFYRMDYRQLYIDISEKTKYGTVTIFR